MTAPRPTAEERAAEERAAEAQARMMRRWAVRVFKAALIVWLYVLVVARVAPDYSGPALPVGMVVSFVITMAVCGWLDRSGVTA